MPNTTPIYGWRYPLANETINTNQIQNLASDMDASFHTWDLNNTAGHVSTGARISQSAQVLTLNVDTTISFATEDWDDGSYWVIGSPTLISVTAGVYHVIGEMRATGTAHGLGLRLKLGGTTIFDETTSLALVGGTNQCVISGLIHVTGANSITLTGRWFGSGTGGAGSNINITIVKVRSTLP